MKVVSFEIQRKCFAIDDDNTLLILRHDFVFDAEVGLHDLMS